MEKEVVFEGIEEYLEPYSPYFRRVEGSQLAQCYLTGLIMDGERKSVEPMAERVQASERGMQRLLTEVKWDTEAVGCEYRHRMLNLTSDPQGVLAIDDTSFPKKGKESVCVARQYCGALGKVANCQVGVSMTYVGQGVAWPYEMELYVPQSWDTEEDPDCLKRREKTGIPEEARYREKWQMALDLVDLARREGVSHRAIVADSWYGMVPDFRRGLVKRHEWYVVGIHSDMGVFLEAPVWVEPEKEKHRRGRPRKYPKVVETNPLPVKVSQIGAAVEEGAWEQLVLRQGSRKKPLTIEAVAQRVWPADGCRNGLVPEETWLIIERRQKEKEGTKLAYFLSNMPQTFPTIEIVRTYHERYWIEQGYQQLKRELGLDHHEGRSWIGWHRHVMLVFLAYGYLTKLRLEQKKFQKETEWKWRVERFATPANGLSGCALAHC